MVNDHMKSLQAIIADNLLLAAERLEHCYPQTIPTYRVEPLCFEDSARAMKRAGARLAASCVAILGSRSRLQPKH